MCSQEEPLSILFGLLFWSQICSLKKGCFHQKGGYGSSWKEFDPKLTAVSFQPSEGSGSS